MVECKPRTREQVIEIVENVLLDMNIDHKHWEEAAEFRKDLAWLRDTRGRCESVKSKGLGVVITALVIGILTILSFGFREWYIHG